MDGLSKWLGRLQVVRHFMTGDKPLSLYSNMLTLTTACESEPGQTVLQEVTLFLLQHPLEEMVGALVQRYKQMRQTE